MKKKHTTMVGRFLFSFMIAFFSVNVFADSTDRTSGAMVQSDSGSIDIPVNPLIELNGVTRDYVLSLHREYINRVSSLAPSHYEPNMAIWGQIQDGKPWWGVLGYYYYGPGEHSIDGPSYLSQFIINPYLLVGFTTFAYVVHDASLTPKDLMPMPIQLTWEQNGSWGQVVYNISDFYQKAQSYRLASAGNFNLELINARDFGFKYFSIDSSRSSGIKASFDKIIPMIQFIHTGGSCGYPGGCNNRSPTQADLSFSTMEVPARIYLKLWKNQVNDPSQRSDMDFIVDLK